jgi:hypothetical protein
MEPLETPCPVEGIVFPDKPRRGWFGLAPGPAGCTGTAAAAAVGVGAPRKGLRSLVVYGA